MVTRPIPGGSDPPVRLLCRGACQHVGMRLGQVSNVAMNSGATSQKKKKGKSRLLIAAWVLFESLLIHFLWCKEQANSCLAFHGYLQHLFEM